MKTNLTTQIIKLSVFIFLFVECRKEDERIIEKSERNPSLSVINKEQLKREIKLHELSTNLTINRSLATEKIEVGQKKFIVELDHITKIISKNNITFYTSFAKEDIENYNGDFYQFIIIKQNEKIEQKLLKFSRNKDGFFFDNSNKFIGSITLLTDDYNFSAKTSNCYFYYEYESVWANCINHGHSTPGNYKDSSGNWYYCDGGHWESQLAQRYTCDGDGGSGGGGTWSNADSYPGPISTTITIENALNYIFQNLNLSNSAKIYLRNTPNLAWYIWNDINDSQKLQINSNEAKFKAEFYTLYPQTTILEFEEWFYESPTQENLSTGLSNSDLNDELLSDWNNPNIVKPTLAFKKNPKINSIYNEAKTAANFNQYLKNFDIDLSVAHLMFDINLVSNSGYLAETDPPSNYWIKITFNKDKDWTNIPKIVIADTFMHEMIHAEIYRKLLSLGSTHGNIDVNKITSDLLSHNYPGLFDYYVRYTKDDTTAQHNMMGKHYVGIMVNFLKQLYGTKYSDSEYKTVVWMGLKETKAWYSLDKSERDLYDHTWLTKYNSWEK